MKSTDPNAPLMVGGAGRIIGLGIERIRQLADAGLLRCVRTASGIRIFKKEDVLEFKAERDQRRKR